ncbi:MAG: hypothetical protein GY702_08090 [Desulfobulbaceae bacterium]|nr:hypothetical protein [Desulfobulbaceae bacterium]
MTYPDEKDHPRSRVKRRSNPTFPIVIFIVAAATAGFYFYINRGISNSYLDYGSAVESSQIPNIQPDSAPHGTSDSASEPAIEASTTNTNETLEKSNRSPSVSDTSSNEDEELVKSGESPGVKDKATSDFEQQLAVLNSFYAHLDEQPYMEEFNLQDSSKNHFSKLIQKLLDNPPIVTRETDDLFTLLKNTAHFFRILGKDNILLLKGILDREKDALEDMLKSFYSLTYKPEYIEREYGLQIDFNALYDYASFLIHTMGGRLYLFRRDSSSRMAVTFYAILIIDRANSEGNSRHGIDIRPAVNSLTEELENGGKRLQFREKYLDTLYDLQEKYN